MGILSYYSESDYCIFVFLKTPSDDFVNVFDLTIPDLFAGLVLKTATGDAGSICQHLVSHNVLQTTDIVMTAVTGETVFHLSFFNG